MRQLPSAGGARVAERAGEMARLHVHAHVCDGSIAEDAAERAAPLIVRAAADEPIKVLQIGQHR